MKKIGIHSVPRSGSSWLGQIFNSSPEVIYKYQPLFSYAFKNYLDEKSSKEETDTFFQKIALTEDEFLDQTYQIKNGNNPEFIKNKQKKVIVYKEVRYHHIIRNMLEVHPEVKIVGLIRNPLAVINSWLKSPREFRKDLGWNIFEEWRYAPKKNQNKKEEFYGFEKWKEVTLLFHELLEKFPERFYLVKYNDLLKDTINVVSDLFKFSGIPLDSQTRNFIKESKSVDKKDPYAVFKVKNEDNDWKTELNKNIADSIYSESRDHPIFKKYL